jgi:pectate lyase
LLLSALPLACGDSKAQGPQTAASGGSEAAGMSGTGGSEAEAGSGATSSGATSSGASSASGGSGGSGLGALAAFPGAQGFGTQTPGGRGGKVFVVTTLDWAGPGSLSEALLASEPRIIVFRVSGVIDIPGGGESVLTEEHSFVTVAGQSSPGGITLRGSETALESYQANFHDAIFRFLRFRGNGNYDNVSFNDTHDFVFDHCDFSGGSDEAFDITFSHDFAVQWTTVTNSGPDGQVYGQLIAYPPTSRISMHHNLSAHHQNRCGPHMHWGADGVAPVEGAEFDYRNNVIYDCAFEKGLDITAPSSGFLAFNIVGNYAKAGPNTPAEGNTALLGIGQPAQVFASDNVYEPDLPVFTIYSDPELRAAPFDFPEVTTEPAQDAFESVLAEVGAWPRDAMNQRTIAEVRDGTGTLSNVSDALIESGPEPPLDVDLDGMADAWESEHGLDPGNAADSAADRDADGYTNIEEYLSELADALIGK